MVSHLKKYLRKREKERREKREKRKEGGKEETRLDVSIAPIPLLLAPFTMPSRRIGHNGTRWGVKLPSKLARQTVSTLNFLPR